MNSFNSVRRHFRCPSFIVGIIFFLTGIWAFIRPEKTIMGAVWVIAVLMLISGIASVALYFDARRFGPVPVVSLISGVLDVILALVLLFNLNGSAVFVGYLFALWFIFDAITVLQLSWLTPHAGLNTLLGILSLLAGMFMLFNPFVGAAIAVWVLGLYLLLFGALLIARAF